MADIQRGHTFTDGSSGNSAADLHELVDDANILPGFITGKSVISALEDTDVLVAYDSSTNDLGKVTFGTLRGSLPTDAAANIPSLRSLGFSSANAAAGNDARFPSIVTGLRVGQGNANIDRAALGLDFRHPVALSGAAEINWDAGNVFYDTLSADRIFTFINLRVGRSIELVLLLNGHIPTLPLDIGTVVVGTGSTILHCYLTYSGIGTTGLQVRI